MYKRLGRLQSEPGETIEFSHVPPHNGRRVFRFLIVQLRSLFFGEPLDAREAVRARHAMVVASEPAEQAGVEILRKGGNAMDAAIAVGFALNAAYPFAGAMGGGGFMTIRLADGTSTFIDFREEAPGKASRICIWMPAGNATHESSRLEVFRRSGNRARVRNGAKEIRQAEMGRRSGARDHDGVEGISCAICARAIAADCVEPRHERGIEARFSAGRKVLRAGRHRLHSPISHAH